MQIFMIVLGVLLVICGISCMFTPLITVMELGYFLALLLLVYGIAHIARSVSSKEYGMDFVFSILSVILGILIIVFPGLKRMTNGMLLYIMAAWFIIQGVISIYNAVKTKKTCNGSKWIWGMCIGILGIIVGVYSAFHPVVLALTVGMMVGCYFIVSGINTIMMSSQYKE